jgi:hypothetical protein
MIYRIPKVDIGKNPSPRTAQDECSPRDDQPFIDSWLVISAGDTRFALDTGGPEKPRYKPIRVHARITEVRIVDVMCKEEDGLVRCGHLRGTDAYLRAGFGWMELDPAERRN